MDLTPRLCLTMIYSEQSETSQSHLSRRGLLATEEAVAMEPPMALSEDAEMSLAGERK